MPTKVLVVDDNLDYAEGVKENLSLYGISAYTATNSQEALSVGEKEKPSIVFIDICLGKENGIDLLRQLIIKLPRTVFFMITGFGTIDSAIASLKFGASDYLQKPVKFEKILELISENIVPDTIETADETKPLVRTAKSEAIRTILRKAEKLARTDLPVLILGENGTGKEVLADYMVSLYQNCDKPYIKINSSAFSETLLDNELFGHEKGAYTGATSTFKGVFERADGGTLFLDEIGDMPTSIQAKILRAIQNHEINRLGSEKTIKIETRFIAATNKNLQALIEGGSFRKDLYYRLNTAQIHLPPLRERREDIPSLVEEFISESSAGRTTQKQIDPEVMEAFMAYQWPGNIRELRNTLLYAAALSSSDTIGMEDLPGTFYGCREKTPILTGLELSEKKIIAATLMKYDYNKSKAASSLGISRSTLYEKIKKYGIGCDE